MDNTSYLPRRRTFGGALLALLASAFFIVAPAQADPPGRIGRIAWLVGTVNLDSTAGGDSFSAPLNQPLTSGDILTTHAGSRVEIQIGSKTVRLDADSVIELDRIDDEQVRLYLSAGRAIVELPTPEAIADFTLLTVNGQFTADEPGTYRFAADTNGSSATAYRGRLHFAGDATGLDLRAGVSAQFWNDGQTRFRLLAPVDDEFSQWSAARDRRAMPATYGRYVSPEMTGAADLDAYGDWSQTPEYGAVWYPRSIAADWAPYRSGSWVWVAPWGWSWVGHEPWGFAPFHYGRWVRHRGNWGWVPGTRVTRPVYAPALVAWIGTPIGRPHTRGGATVGWFPLAPREVYVPVYRSSADYVRRVNRTHVTQINNITMIVNSPQTAVQRTRYAHREVPQAVTVVPGDVVTSRRPVAAAAIAQRDSRALREQPLQATAPVAAPLPRTGRPERAGRAGGERERGAGPQAVSPESITTRNIERRDSGGRRDLSQPAAPAAVITAPAGESRRTETLRTGPQAVSPDSITTQSSERRAPGGRRDVIQPPAAPAAPAAAAVPAPPSEPRRPEAIRPGPQFITPESIERRERRDSAQPPAPAAVITAPASDARRSEAPPGGPQFITPQSIERRDAGNRRDAAQPAAPAAIITAPSSPTPQFRSQTTEPARQERPGRRDEAAVRVPQREIRVEPAPPAIVRQAPAAPVAPPVIRQAPSAPPAIAREAPREVARPPEARPEARPQRQDERQRGGAGGDEGQRQRRGDGERR